MVAYDPHRTLVIHKRTLSDWISCQSITQNLLNVYQGARRFTFTSDTLTFDERRELEALLNEGIERIIWLEHAPHPKFFVEQIHHFYEQKKHKRPALFFHLYGDFNLQLPQWIELSPILSCYATHFYCASTAHQKMVQQLLCSNEQITTLPFPINSEDYFYAPELRARVRKKHHIPSDQVVFFYAGRLSLQKNIVELIDLFSQANALRSSPAILFLAGEFDDINLPYLGLQGTKGSYQRYFETRLKGRLPSPDIIFLGLLESAELNSYYNAADYYINLSTHNDEDFGMGPAEAAMTGASLYLTDWAGFRDFRQNLGAEQVQTCAILSKPDRFLPQPTSVFSFMMKATQPERRAEYAHQASRHYSLLSVASHLERSPVSGRHFGGFTPLANELSGLMKVQPKAPFRSSLVQEYSALYFRLYQSYAQFRHKIKSSDRLAIHSTDFKSLDDLQAFPEVCLKDGALSLWAFFLTHSTPPSFPLKIHVHQSLSALVPQAWRESTAYYRVQAKHPPRRDQQRLLVDLYYSGLAGLDSFTGALLLELPPFALEESERVLSDHSPLPFIKGGLPLSWTELLKGDLSRFTIETPPHDLTHFATTRLEHELLGRGASQTHWMERQGNEHEEELSPHHLYLFHEHPKDEDLRQADQLYRLWREYYPDAQNFEASQINDFLCGALGE